MHEKAPPEPPQTSSQREGFTPDQRAAWERLVRAVRTIAEQVVQLDAPVAQLDAAASQLEALSASLAPRTGSRPIARFQLPLDLSQPNHHITYSPVSGRFNALSPPVDLSVEGGRVIGCVTLGGAYEGAIGLVHGGVIAMIWDEVLAIANLTQGTGGPTGELRVRFIAPTPLDRPLRFEAWHEQQQGRRILAKGRCYAGDAVVSEAEGLYIALDLERAPDSAWGVNTQSAGLRPETPPNRRST